jgi:hypothetical protein
MKKCICADPENCTEVPPNVICRKGERANYGWWVEFKRGWWARCLGPNKDRKDTGQTSGHYHGSVTEAEAIELERRINDFLGRKGWPDGDAQAEIMRGGADVKITVGGSAHVRSIREWHALAVASFADPERKAISDRENALSDGFGVAPSEIR